MRAATGESPLRNGVSFPSARSRIDRETLEAYRTTLYRVQDDLDFTLKVGQSSPSLARLQRHAGVNGSAFVTASNPFSQRLTEEENRKREAALESEIKRSNRPYRVGFSHHPSNGWPDEASLLILGLSREEAIDLGNRFQQNALIWSGPDAIPRLILLR